MEIEQVMGGDFTMALSDGDIALLHKKGFIDFSCGLDGPYSNVHVSYGNMDVPAARIQPGMDLDVTIPHNDDPVVTIEHAQIEVAFEELNVLKQRFLGKAGRIILQADHDNKYGRWYS